MLESAQAIDDFKLDISGYRCPTGSHSATLAAVAAARSKGLILPNLRLLSLDSHTIKLETLLEFVGSYQDSLETRKLWHIRDGDADYLNLHERLYEVLAIPQHAPRTTDQPSDWYLKERRGGLELSIFDCYNGDFWIERDRLNHLETMGVQVWPRPWPVLQL